MFSVDVIIFQIVLTFSINGFWQKTATPASENDGEGTRSDPDGPSVAMDADTTVATGNVSQGGTPTPDENKQSSDTDIGQEAGQLEADAEVEPGMIDGETDAEVDLDTAG